MREITYLKRDVLIPNHQYNYRIFSDTTKGKMAPHISSILPILVLESGENFLIIDGLKRFMNLTDREEFPVYIYKSHEFITAFEEGLYLNQTHAPLSTIEQINVINVCNYTLKVPNDVREHFAGEYLRIPWQKKFENIYTRIHKFSPQGKIFLHRLNPSWKQLQQILAYPDELISWLMEMNSEIYFKVKDMLTLLEQLWQYKQSGNPISREEFVQYLGEQIWTQLSPDKRLHAMKSFLNRENHPELTSRREKIDKIKKVLKQQGIEIDYDLNFERPGISFSYNLKSVQDLQQLKKTLLDNEFDKSIENLLQTFQD